LADHAKFGIATIIPPPMVIRRKGHYSLTPQRIRFYRIAA
jgi:hypothetical protein